MSVVVVVVVVRGRRCRSSVSSAAGAPLGPVARSRTGRSTSACRLSPASSERVLEVGRRRSRAARSRRRRIRRAPELGGRAVVQRRVAADRVQVGDQLIGVRLPGSCRRSRPSRSRTAPRRRPRAPAGREVRFVPGIAASLVKRSTAALASPAFTAPRRGAGPGAPAARSRRSRRRPGRSRSRPGGRWPPRHPVSSSSQAARGSPSRGWPTLPGLISQRPSERSSRVPALGLGALGGVRRARPARRRAGFAGHPGHDEEQRHVGVADQADPRRLDADALRGLVGPQHVLPDRVARARRDTGPPRGSRRPAPARAGSRSSRAWPSPASSARRPRPPGEKDESSSSPRTARSWLPTRQSSHRSATRLRRTRRVAPRSRPRRRGTRAPRGRRPRRRRAPPRGQGGSRGCR